ncbi:metalloproteinase inhibitor 2-like [Ylistrum balloti]|uniref:metalloproteinase inhibitor 2-like n=1 Tax=Ylistrum balloti TaxID=509963 RepID=UPI002905968F|nr:metalloproteinase inhibitor 2-like [Ylistrum balloti]
MLGVAIFLVAGLLLSFMPASNGCSCVFRHPQQVVCESDFVIKGIQVGSKGVPIPGSIPPFGGDVVYDILVKYVIKGEGIKVGDTIKVRTGSSSAACGVSITAGALWLLTGRKTVSGDIPYSISSCDWNTECSNLTPQQISFLRPKGRKSYFGRKDNCKNCKIERCPDNDCSKPAAGQCLTDAKPCYAQTLKCQYTGKRCRWRKRKDAKKCFKSLN